MESFNFTVPAVEAIAHPDKGRVRYQDTKRPNLVLHVTPTAKTFYFLKRSGGKLYEKRIGAHPTFKPDEARGKVDEMLGALERGEDPDKVGGRKRRGDTFGDLFHWWLEVHARPNLKPRTARAAETLYARELARTIGSQRVEHITRADLQALHTAITSAVVQRGRYGDRQRYNGAYTANETIRLVGNVIRYAIQLDRFKGHDPTLGVRRARTESRERILTPDEMPAFLNALAIATPLVRDTILIALYTGVRQNNVLAMRWDEIDWKARTWRIPHTKNGSPQIVPLEDAELQVLRDRQAGPAGKSEWVFPSRFKTAPRGHVVAIEKGWNEVVKAAGLSDLRYHDLRRSFASWMLFQGTSLKVVSKSLNHRSMKITDRIYAQIMGPEQIRAGKRATHAAYRAGDGDQNVIGPS